MTPLQPRLGEIEIKPNFAWRNVYKKNGVIEIINVSSGVKYKSLLDKEDISLAKRFNWHLS